MLFVIRTNSFLTLQESLLYVSSLLCLQGQRDISLTYMHCSVADSNPSTARWEAADADATKLDWLTYYTNTTTSVFLHSLSTIALHRFQRNRPCLYYYVDAFLTRPLLLHFSTI